MTGRCIRGRASFNTHSFEINQQRPSSPGSGDQTVATSGLYSSRNNNVSHKNRLSDRREGWELLFFEYRIGWDKAFESTSICDAVSLSGDLSPSDATITSPGDATNALLNNRSIRREAHGMPPLATNLVDVDGVQLLTDWIDGLSGYL